MEAKVYRSTIWFTKDNKTVVVEPESLLVHGYLKVNIETNGPEHVYNMCKDAKERHGIKAIQTSKNRWRLKLKL